MSSKEQINFCDNDMNYDDCTICPKGGVCENGSLIGCFNDYVFLNEDSCIPESRFDDLIFEMTEFTFAMIASVNGINKCYDQGKSNLDNKVFIKDIKIELKRIFKNRENYKGAIHLLFKKVLDHYEFELDYDRNEYYLPSNRVSLTFYCKCKLIFIKHTLRIMFTLIVFLIVFLLLLRELQSIKHAKWAEKIYKRIVVKLQKHKKVE